MHFYSIVNQLFNGFAFIKFQKVMVNWFDLSL